MFEASWLLRISVFLSVVIQVEAVFAKIGSSASRSATIGKPRSPEPNMQEDLDAPAPKRAHNLAHDLVEKLTQSILLGQMSPGDKLPSENAIVQDTASVARWCARRFPSCRRQGWWRRGTASALCHRTRRRAGFAPECRYRARRAQHSGVAHGPGNQAAALAAQRRSEQQLLQMRQALDDYQRLLDSNDSCVEADRRFHLLIAEATGNVCFSEIMQHLGSAMIPRQRLNAAERGAADLSKLGQLAHLEHEAILNAIKRQDPTRRARRCGCT
jgi:DNA-binding GntR family transcriptional regulator